MLTLLSASILTCYGKYHYRRISLDEARRLVRKKSYTSAVGHSATAWALTKLLGVGVKRNRVCYKQDIGEQALVFKVRSRLPEGQYLSVSEIEEIGYEFGLLTRVS